MNVLVLGGTGYLGSKLVRMLHDKGNNVIVTKRANSDISKLAGLKNVRIIPASVDAVEVTAGYIKFDYMINAACNYGRENVLYGDVIEANIEFPLKMLNKLVENGTKNFMTIGTGLPNDFNMYSFSKKMFAEFGKFYVDKHDVNYCALLLEMFYGADEPANRFLPSLIRKMINGEEVSVSIGSQKRDIIAVSDILKAIEQILFSDKTLGYREIPVGTGVSPTIAEIVDYIWDETGRVSTINWGAFPMRENEPDCCADISILQEYGVWDPIFWKDGISQMINEVKEGMKK